MGRIVARGARWAVGNCRCGAGEPVMVVADCKMLAPDWGGSTAPPQTPGGVEVGYAVVLKGSTVPGYWNVGSIGVAEAARGRKYGSALLSFATAHIHAQGKNAMITTDSENAAMIAAATHQGDKSR